MFNGKKCKDEYVYTHVNGNATCDGWQGLSFLECKQKCINNELPNGCNNKPSNGCSYANWYSITKWCHLAKEGCVLENGVDGAITWKQTSKYWNFSSVCKQRLGEDSLK